MTAVRRGGGTTSLIPKNSGHLLVRIPCFYICRFLIFPRYPSAEERFGVLERETDTERERQRDRGRGQGLREREREREGGRRETGKAGSAEDLILIVFPPL